MAVCRKVMPCWWLLLLAGVRFARAVDTFGPLVKATEGEVWPRPHSQITYDAYMLINPSNFTFSVKEEETSWLPDYVRRVSLLCQVSNKTCGILEEAVRRYSDSVYRYVPSRGGDLRKTNVGHLDTLSVLVTSSCEEYPYLGMDEEYELKINNVTAVLTSKTVWGALRGLETFSQLLYIDHNKEVRINSTAISDQPRFPHRGLLLDTSRHYMPLSVIREMLDGMEMNKMNVFHWHIVDSQSFPYQSRVFPDLRYVHGAFVVARKSSVGRCRQTLKEPVVYTELRPYDLYINKLCTFLNYLPVMVMSSLVKCLFCVCPVCNDLKFNFKLNVLLCLSEKGAYDPETHIYTHDDIKNITEYARLRGIRVMPEFDTPGHTLSWGPGQPDLLTPCYSFVTGKPDGTYGPINPSLESTYTFIEKLFQEVVALFPDSYLHLGGDEVSFVCWRTNPNVTSFMMENGISNYAGLEQYYMQRVVNITSYLNASSVVWQEVFDNGVTIPDSTVVHVWTGSQAEELSKASARLHLAQSIYRMEHSCLECSKYFSSISFPERCPERAVWVLQVTAAGHRALLSACWYLGRLESGGDWRKFYECEPTQFYGTDEQKQRVMGGEACMWGEVVDESNVVARVWPRASATAEKLWSSAGADTEDGASRRLEEHYCRMRRRGVGAQPPNGPGYCR
ncbi:hypothetical protein PR048_026418 [Dryococelus australis]|uniref:Beta-hexosaminidase n=1 Tax=Dryococelus australis TaxID=614101 RepID=A0ABQ9GLB5_9NEOP|nr:hypothetical protein PR048_026418 [Dryococelus australis]